MNTPFIRAFNATTTTTLILSARKERKAVLIYNNGAATVYLLSGKNQIAADGIPILIGLVYESDHYNCQGEYFIVSEAGTVNLRIEETIAEKDEERGEKECHA